jgi:hypothetical protein
VRFCSGVSFVIAGSSVVLDLLLNVTDFRREIAPGVLSMPTFDGLRGDDCGARL